MQKIVSFLWFDGKAEEAANYYVSLFKDSRITNISRYSEAGPLPAGTVMVVEFELAGQEFMAVNGGPGESAPSSTYPGSVSLFVNCEDQAEVDRLWDELSENGKKLPCGWVVDKYGFTWNIVPRCLSDYLGGEDEQGAQRAMKAMLQMEKIDIDELRRAYEGV